MATVVALMTEAGSVQVRDADGLSCRFLSIFLSKDRGRISSGGRLTFLARTGVPDQRKVSKRSAPLLSATPSLRCGATCAEMFAGCAVELTTRQGAPFKQPRRVSSRSMRAGARMPARKRPITGAYRRGDAVPPPHAERSDGMQVVKHPSSRAEKHRPRGGRVPKDTRPRRHACRICLNGAPWRVVSYAARPWVEHRRLPQCRRRWGHG